MKGLCKNIFAAIAGLAIAGGMTGCAHEHEDRHRHHHHHRGRDHAPGMGAAPGGVTGSAQGGTVRTESVMPGVGSALFPNPDGL